MALTPAQCRDLYKRILANISNLEERISKYDPIEDGKGGHPYSVGGVIHYTQKGIHYVKIMQLQARLWTDIALYQAECGSGPKVPCQKFKIIGEKIPKPLIVPYGITNFELQAQYESAQYISEFWRTILWGDIALGAVGTGGALGAFSGAGASAGSLAPALAH